MKSKVLNLSIVLSSLVAYLEWGTEQSSFLYEMEAEVLFKFFTNPRSVIHPFIVIPLLGQVLLLTTLFQNKPSKILSIAGTISIGLLLTLVFAIGLIELNWKILLYSLPFNSIAFYTLLYNFRKK